MAQKLTRINNLYIFFMNPILFGVVFASIMIYMMVSFILMRTSLPVVKAGKVSDPYHKFERVRGCVPKSINVAGKKVDVSEHVVLSVHGNSMIKYKIKDKQLVFVKKLERIDNLNGHPVLVFKIMNHKPDDAEFKLRKFVNILDSIDDVDWGDVYESNKERIKISKEDFIEQCGHKAQKSKETLKGKIILSETFDEIAQHDCYSLHPVSDAYATVEYAV